MDEISKGMLLLIGGVIAWAGLGLTNWRFRSERALLVIKKLRRDERGDLSVTVANIGGRAALDVIVRLEAADWTHVEHGIAPKESFSADLPKDYAGSSITIEYTDADLHNISVVREADFGERPRLLPRPRTGVVKQMAGRLGFVSLD